MSVAFTKPFPCTIRVTVKDAANFVNNFESHLLTFTHKIKSKVDNKLPKHLNSPEGNVAGVTMKSVQLISSVLNRLNEITEDHSYRNVNLLSCLTLDVKYFHSSTHFKFTVLSIRVMECSLLHGLKLVPTSR